MSERAWWTRPALAVIVLAATVGYAWDLTGQGFSYAYYSAAAKTMSQSPQAFLFGTYDPLGVLTIDKPPLGVWPQVVSVWIFGLHGWAVLLPQVIAGAAAVVVLYATVRRLSGSARVGLLAAAVLATTPVTMAITRDNAPDPWLTLTLVSAAWALARSLTSTTARTRWLLLSAALLGCGFLVKMGQALVVVPAFVLAYVIGTSAPLLRRWLDVAAAAAVVVVTSLWWVVLVDLWPGDKPFVGGSTDGSAWDLTVGYNGFGRIVGQDAAEGNEAGAFYSEPGIGRLFSQSLGGQIAWLVPLALIGAVAAVSVWKRIDDRRVRAGWALFGGWLLCGGLVLSFMTGVWLPYYTSMLAPAVAALAALTIALFWRWRTESDLRRFALPGVVALSAGWAYLLIDRDPDWNGWLRIPVVAAGVLAVVALVARRHQLGLALGLAAVLVAPAFWSAATAAGYWVGWATNPAAGPISAQTVFLPDEERPEWDTFFAGRAAAELKATTGQLDPEQTAILEYVRENAPDTEIQLAAEGGALFTGNYIINSDLRVVAMGGFTTDDPAPTVDQLAGWVEDGRVRFVLTDFEERARIDWAREHCVVVPPEDYFPEAATELFDCA
ncbi:glycosyltransferase family 39 protein [Actinophytocola sediminis]